MESLQPTKRDPGQERSPEGPAVASTMASQQGAWEQQGLRGMWRQAGHKYLALSPLPVVCRRCHTYQTGHVTGGQESTPEGKMGFHEWEGPRGDENVFYHLNTGSAGGTVYFWKTLPIGALLHFHSFRRCLKWYLWPGMVRACYAST